MKFADKYDVPGLLAAAIVLAAAALVPVGYHSSHPIKHTGAAQFLGTKRSNPKCYWFERPDAEIFEMCFDNPPPWQPNLNLADIAYTDDNDDYRHLVKAQVK